ncbi:hypothetical protein MMC09_003781 [Bachmanniomyces sp. S44760]|nr:hypothetical protein [Bachmanniomyces sp. S44760]
MAIKGHRFEIDLPTEEAPSYNRNLPGHSASAFNFDFIKDISERPTTAATPPTPPKFRSSETGFPGHKKRTGASRFKQQTRAGGQDDGLKGIPTGKTKSARQGHVPGSDAEARTGHDSNMKDLQKDSIDAENQERLARMSSTEIEEERSELMKALSPSLIERLLKRAVIDDGQTDVDRNISIPLKENLESSDSIQSPTAQDSKSNREPLPTPEHVFINEPMKSKIALSNNHPDDAPVLPSPDLHPASSNLPLLPPPSIHFPPPTANPSLDPSDPDFLEKLHSLYFPHLPADPSKLAWMAPIPTEDSTADKDSPYHPSQDALAATSLRFDFRGRLIPPQLARQIPSTKGLHHHGTAPEAAGYTLPELAHLSRSAVPAQRCMAYQTLGRILYRLGRGDFGNEDQAEELYLGMWKGIEGGRVIDTLLAEAAVEDGVGNRSCKVIATEAVWLWQKGGGKRRKAR